MPSAPDGSARHTNSACHATRKRFNVPGGESHDGESKWDCDGVGDRGLMGGKVGCCLAVEGVRRM